MSLICVDISSFSLSWQNISQFLLILVGTSAIVVYLWQDSAKKKDAASLVILQIDELQGRVREIQSYISSFDQSLNSTAFYESLPIMEVNYSNQYKHLLIRKMDNKSYNDFNKFYEYISCIQEQQQFVRNLQRNFFFVKQNAISNCESLYIYESLKVKNDKTLSGHLQNQQEDIINSDPEKSWKEYQDKRQNLIGIMNKDSLTQYIPVQISVTLRAVLKQYALLEITGTEGYRKLRKLAKI